MGKSSLTHWQFLASSPFLCQVASSAQAGGEGTDGAGSPGDGSAGGAGSAGGEGSAGPEAGGGVCARSATTRRAARRIERRDIFCLPGVAIPKHVLGGVG